MRWTRLSTRPQSLLYDTFPQRLCLLEQIWQPESCIVQRQFLHFRDRACGLLHCFPEVHGIWQQAEMQDFWFKMNFRSESDYNQLLQICSEPESLRKKLNKTVNQNLQFISETTKQGLPLIKCIS